LKKQFQIIIYCLYQYKLEKIRNRWDRKAIILDEYGYPFINLLMALLNNLTSALIIIGIFIGYDFLVIPIIYYIGFILSILTTLFLFVYLKLHKKFLGNEELLSRFYKIYPIKSKLHVQNSILYFVISFAVTIILAFIIGRVL